MELQQAYNLAILITFSLPIEKNSRVEPKKFRSF
jgi:hypothetical protein